MHNNIIIIIIIVGCILLYTERGQPGKNNKSCMRPLSVSNTNIRSSIYKQTVIVSWLLHACLATCMWARHAQLHTAERQKNAFSQQTTYMYMYMHAYNYKPQIHVHVHACSMLIWPATCPQ